MHFPMDYSISNIGNLFINTASSLLLCWCYWCVARLFKLCETGKPEKPKPSASPPLKPSVNTSTANPVTYSIIKMTKIKRINLPQVERGVSTRLLVAFMSYAALRFGKPSVFERPTSA